MKYLKLLLLANIIAVLFFSCKKDDPPKPTGPTHPDIPFNPTPYNLTIPEFFPIIDIPEDNPLTVEGIALGRMLFYDPILSGDSTLSCAGCHKQEYAFTDENRFSTGIDGIMGDRNAMQVINMGWVKKLFWDGRADLVEGQALGPVENPIEMHDTWPNVVEKLTRHPDYPTLFFKTFGTWDITKELAAKAIGQFERTLISANSKYDLVIAANNGVFLTDEEVNGFDIFNTEKGDCFHCHSGILFTDDLFHNNGLDSVQLDKGLGNITGNVHDNGKFKTPTLRNIALTAPYMHDGRFQTLEEVVDFYSEGLQFSESIDPLMKNVQRGGIQLTAQEKSDLIAFLHTLTDTTFTNNPDFANPF